MKNRMQ